MEKAKNFISLILVLILSFFTVKPLLSSGYFPMHDDTQPARVYEMTQSLRDGQFPVRWVKDLGYGYGYPIFNFYAPLPYYFGAVWVMGGIGVIDATKIMFTVGILIAGLTMYWLGEKLWGRWGGLLAAILYMYAPYHGVQIFVRGAVGESWAYGFLPLVGVGLMYLFDLTNLSNLRKGILIGGLGLAAVVLSHNIIGMLTVMLLGILTVLYIFLIKSKNRISLIGLLSLISVGLGLSAFFWLPALFESGLTKVAALSTGTNDYRQHFLFLDQLWNSPWGYAGSGPGRLDGMSFMIGKLQMIFGLFGIGFWIWGRMLSQNKKGNWEFLGLVGLVLITMVMMLPISQPLWELLPFGNFVQYPWRFLVFTDFFIVLVGGYIAVGLVKSGKWERLGKFGILGLTILVVAINQKYFRPQYTTPQNDSDYISEENLKWKISKISDEYLPLNFPIPQDKTQIANNDFEVFGDIIVEQSEIRSNLIKLNVNANNTSVILINRAFFPSWETVIDTQKVQPMIEKGLIKLNIPSGRHIITVYFRNTWVRNMGNFITFVFIIVLFYLSVMESLHIKFFNSPNRLG